MMMMRRRRAREEGGRRGSREWMEGGLAALQSSCLQVIGKEKRGCKCGKKK